MNETEKIVNWQKKNLETWKDEKGEHLVPMSLEQMNQLNRNMQFNNKLVFIVGIVLFLLLLFLIVIATRTEVWTHMGQRVFCG